MSSPEARELIRVVHQSFKDRESVDCFVFSRPRLINNANLLDKVFVICFYIEDTQKLNLSLLLYSLRTGGSR